MGGCWSIAPGSGAVAKNWPENHFSAVAEWWRDRMNGSVVVLVGPVEEERGGFTALSSHGLTLHNLDLAKAAALLERQFSIRWQRQWHHASRGGHRYTDSCAVRSFRSAPVGAARSQGIHLEPA